MILVLDHCVSDAGREKLSGVYCWGIHLVWGIQRESKVMQFVQGHEANGI